MKVCRSEEVGVGGSDASLHSGELGSGEAGAVVDFTKVARAGETAPSGAVLERCRGLGRCNAVTGASGEPVDIFVLASGNTGREGERMICFGLALVEVLLDPRGSVSITLSYPLLDTRCI